MRISIVISTRDHAEDLRATLRSLASVTIPSGASCEVVIVDNGSSDRTPQVIAETTFPNMSKTTVREQKPGLSNARNRGLAQSHGDIVVFTDDDLRYPEEWLQVMTEPLIEGKSDAVTGTMVLAPHLERPWMKELHRVWLAAPIDYRVGEAKHLIGANMAFRREVFDRVHRFDPELGPGALGFGEDSLFAHQLLRAEYKILSVKLRAEHHFLPSRLTRAGFLDHAKKLGMSGAYTDHHWEHHDYPVPRLQVVRKIIQIAVWRAAHRVEIERSEGMHEREMHHLRSLHLYGHFAIERRRPRNYEYKGLLKLH